MIGGGGRGAGRPELTDELAATLAARIIDVALALKRGVSDAELLRRFKLTKRKAVALVEKRQRHPLVVAHLGDSVDDLRPKKQLLEGAARYALALVDANPRMKLTAAIQLAARRVQILDPEVVLSLGHSSTVPRRGSRCKPVAVSGVRRAVERIQREGGAAVVNQANEAIAAARSRRGD